MQVLDFARRILNMMYTNQAEEALLLLQCISSRNIMTLLIIVNKLLYIISFKVVYTF